MDSPRAQTRAWSAMVMGFVRKKKPRVMWKSESEVMIVFADMRAISSLGQPAGWFVFLLRWSYLLPVVARSTRGGVKKQIKSVL